MSYKYRVLADRPLGYWRLNSSTLLDETTVANPVTTVGGSSAVFTDVLPIVTGSSYDSNIAACQVKSTTRLSISNSSDTYKSFYLGTESLSFGFEFWISFDKNPSLETDIISVKLSNSLIARIYVLNDQIYFAIGSNIVYKQVKTWDSQCHIFAYYSDKKMGIYVNGIPGDTLNLGNSFKFSTSNSSKTSIYYQIGPAPTNQYYTINSLAFYDYVLSPNLIRSHMVWGTNDSKPQLYVKETSGHFFDIQDFDYMFDFKKVFAKASDYQEGLTSTLVSDDTGLTIATSSTAGAATGTWTYFVPSSTYSKIFGFKISWDSATTDDSTTSPNEYVKVEMSTNGGTSWTQVKNGYPLLKFADSSLIIYSDILVRVTIHTSDQTQEYLPRIDNLLIGVYKDLSIQSDLGEYVLSPRLGSYIGDTYSIKSNSFNLLARPDNFGIKLNQTNSTDNVAVIYPQEQSAGYQSLEFWFRYDEQTNYINQYIVDTLGFTAYLYFVKDVGVVYQNGFSNVYINGSALTVDRKLIQGEMYHIVCVYPTIMNNQIYLGGSTFQNQYSRSTFGMITLYPNAISQSDAQNRYLSYLTSFSAQVNYASSIGTSSNYIGTISSYVGGSTAYNSGQDILAYARPSTAQ